MAFANRDMATAAGTATGTAAGPTIGTTTGTTTGTSTLCFLMSRLCETNTIGFFLMPLARTCPPSLAFL